MLSEAAHKDPAMSGQLDYERREGDFYPTPPENVDCLAHFIDLSNHAAWEPACGEGHISKRLLGYARAVVSSDLHNRGYGSPGFNFLDVQALPRAVTDVCDDFAARPAIITNPPYFDDMPEQFVRHALKLTHVRGGLVAMFLRNEYDMASTGRADLFEGHPAFAMKICVTKRPRWIEGSKGSPRHSYAWFIWDWRKAAETPAAIHYIHPRNARKPTVN